MVQDVSKIPDTGKPCFGFSFPSPSMVGVFVPLIPACRARAVLIVSDIKAPWFSLLMSALVRTKTAASKADPDVFFRVRHSHGRTVVVSQKWGMRAVEVDFL